MAIPNDDIIQQELIALIASKPDKRVHASNAYEELARLHPEITQQELIERYQNSVSKWANRVQFARLHLVNKGLLYRANAVSNASTGYWMLTPDGEIVAAKLEPHSKLLESLIEEDLHSFDEENQLSEGGKKYKLVSFYERNPKIRLAAIKAHGTSCKACGFNFFHMYGEHGQDYIEVHHLVPVSTYIEPSVINPKTDLTVLCSNCHRMAHRNRNKPLSIKELKELIGRYNHKPTQA